MILILKYGWIIFVCPLHLLLQTFTLYIFEYYYNIFSLYFLSALYKEKKVNEHYYFFIYNICGFLFVGICHCFPGWTGTSCSKTCPNGTYGINCGLQCKCQNNGLCHAIDGACHCKPGFTGHTCSEGV